ncbi:hypothetical protein BWR60_07500 [Inquilinus limosus]|uniref:Uncharacterized protein n=2 Tax=Inquilinus limosus TaxID=171674 RepID=A0A211ZRL9_9PROT|nr:hypothetical protein BWR60_07500 [Inquilinus limosus]
MLAATMAVVATGADAAEATWLRAALSSMPATAFDLKPPFLASAINLSAARALGLRDHDTQPADLLKRVLTPPENIGVLDAWIRRTDAGLLEDRLGVPLDRLAVLAGYNDLPNQTTLWIFDSDGTADAVFGGLPARGFSPLTGGMLANGKPSEMDLKSAAPGDPWRGDLGRTSVVGREGRILLQAREPDLIEAARQATPASNLATVPFVNTVLTGAEAGAGDGAEIIHALLAGPQIGAGRDFMPEMAMLKPNDLQAQVETLRRKMEDQAAQERATGLPPYPVALLADIEIPGKSRGILLAFPYPDCRTAETGATRFAARWRTAELATYGHGTTLADMTGADIATRTVPASDGSCAAVVTATNPVPADGASFENKPWTAVIGSIYRRDFGAAAMALGGPDR